MIFEFCKCRSTRDVLLVFVEPMVSRSEWRLVREVMVLTDDLYGGLDERAGGEAGTWA